MTIFQSKTVFYLRIPKVMERINRGKPEAVFLVRPGMSWERTCSQLGTSSFSNWLKIRPLYSNIISPVRLRRKVGIRPGVERWGEDLERRWDPSRPSCFEHELQFLRVCLRTTMTQQNWVTLTDYNLYLPKAEFKDNT
jgi:hypothetical protein